MRYASTLVASCLTHFFGLPRPRGGEDWGIRARISRAILTVLLLAGCEWREITQEKPDEPAGSAPASVSTSSAAGWLAVKVTTAPTLDGKGADEAWSMAPAYVIPLQGYSGDRITMQAVYTDTHIFFLLSWADYSHSIRQAGSWGRVHVGAQFGKASAEALDRWERFGVEDTLSLLWNIDSPDIRQADWSQRAHFPDTQTTTGRVDRWFWAAGTTDPVHRLLDQYVDTQGLHTDSGTSFLVPNFTDQDNPATPLNETAYPVYMPRVDLTQRKIPKLFVVKGEKPVLLYYQSEVESFDLATVDREATLPGHIFADTSSGSVTDVTVSSAHATETETWTLEIQRQRTTSTPHEDVQFDEVGTPYAFVIGVFDNTDVDGSFSQLHTLTLAK